MWKKVLGGLVAIAIGLVAIVGAIDLTVDRVAAIQTDKEATTWRKGHELTEAEKFKNDRVDRLERENQRIRRQLANPNIEDWDKEQLILDRNENLEKVKCIRADRC